MIKSYRCLFAAVIGLVFSVGFIFADGLATKGSPTKIRVGDGYIGVVFTGDANEYFLSKSDYPQFGSDNKIYDRILAILLTAKINSNSVIIWQCTGASVHGATGTGKFVEATLVP